MSMSDCAMWLRRNKILGIPIPGYYGYNGYPIGDANGEATGYFDDFVSTMQSNGINNIEFRLRRFAPGQKN